jgi:hypothetical protein
MKCYLIFALLGIRPHHSSVQKERVVALVRSVGLDARLHSRVELLYVASYHCIQGVF